MLGLQISIATDAPQSFSNVSKMPCILSDVTPNGWSGAHALLAYEPYSTRADVRSGYVAAYRRDIGPPSETPISAARLEPVASNTALTSSMRSSSVGIATRSERPVPRLSKRIRREKEASRRKNLAGRGCSQSYSKCDKPRHPEKVDGP